MAYRANALSDAHREDPEFGYRFFAGEASTVGESVAERTAWRICRDNACGRCSARSAVATDDDRDRRFMTIWSSATSLLRRKTFMAERFTDHLTGDGRLYLCAIKDVRSGLIVGYSIDSQMKARLAVVRCTVRSPVEVRCRVHRSLGSRMRNSVPQVSARLKYSRVNRVDGQSWSVWGQRRDGEPLRATATQRPRRQRWDTRELLRIAIVTWIERTYLRRRRQARLGRLTPVEFEAAINTAAVAV